MGPVDGEVLERAVRESPLHERYAQAVDRESAFEKLAARPAGHGAKTGHEGKKGEEARGKTEGTKAETEEAKEAKGGGKERSVVEQVVDSGVFRSLARSVGTQLGREITRSLFGTARRRR